MKVISAIIEVIISVSKESIIRAINAIAKFARKSFQITKKLIEQLKSNTLEVARKIKKNLTSAFSKARESVSRFSTSVKNEFNKVKRYYTRTLKTIKSGFSKLSSLAASGVGAAHSLISSTYDRIREFIQNMSQFQTVENSLSAIEGSAQKSQRAFHRLSDISLNSAYSLKEVADIYSNLRSTLSQNAALSITEQISKLSSSLGLSAEQVEAFSQVISRTFEKGAFGVDEFNQLMNTSPALISTLARSLGMTTEQFRTMAASGKISVQQIQTALSQMANNSKQPVLNMSQALSKVFDTLMLKVYQIGSKFGLWNTITRSLQTLTQWIDRGADAFENWISNIAGLKETKGFIDSIKQGVKNFYESFKSAFQRAGGDVQNFTIYLKTLWKIVASALGPVFQWLGKLWGNVFGFAIGIISRVARKITELYIKVLEFIKGAAELYNRVAGKIGWKEIDTSGLKSKIEEIRSLLNTQGEETTYQPEPEPMEAPPGAESLQESTAQVNQPPIQQPPAQKASGQSNANESQKDEVDQIIDKTEEFKSRFMRYYRALQDKTITQEQFQQKLQALSEEYGKYGVRVDEIAQRLMNQSNAEKSQLDIVNEKIQKTQEFISQYENLNQALEKGIITTEEYSKALKDLKNTYAEAGVNIEKAIELSQRANSAMSNALKQTLNQLENMAVNQATQIGMEIGKAIMGSGSVSLRQFGQQFIGQLTSILTQSLMAINPILGVMAALIGGILQGMLSVGSANVNQNVQQNINVVINIGEAVINDKEYWERWLERVFVPSLERTVGKEESRG